VDTGFTMTISSDWNNATIYGSIDIELQEFQGFQNFDADGTVLQLPRTTERELSTQIRIRPGDSLLIAGLVRESDQYDSSGPGFNRPFFPTTRGVSVANTELVFLLKPRVIVYTADEVDNQGGRSQSSVNTRTSPGKVYEDDVFPMGTLSSDQLNPSLSNE
jgi:type II secretory pathway component GspD/PulD (secretin)